MEWTFAKIGAIIAGVLILFALISPSAHFGTLINPTQLTTTTITTAGGTVGSGTSTQISYFVTTSTISSSPNLTYNATTGLFTVGTSTITNATITNASTSRSDVSSGATFGGAVTLDPTKTFTFGLATSTSATSSLSVANASTSILQVGSSITIVTSTLPTGALFHIASTTNILTVLGNGNVGIGISTPQSLLHLVSNNGTLPGLNGGTLEIVQNNVNATDNSRIAIIHGTTGFGMISFGVATAVQRGFISYGQIATDALNFHVNNATDAMVILSTGNVGIGTTSPGALLHVAGTAWVNSLNVTSTSQFNGAVTIDPTKTLTFGLATSTSATSSLGIANASTSRLDVGNSFTVGASTTLLGTFALSSLDATTTQSFGNVSNLAAGACTSTTVSIPGATTSSVVYATPQTYPGDGAFWFGYISSTGTATVKVCASILETPTASQYNVRIIR